MAPDSRHDYSSAHRRTGISNASRSAGECLYREVRKPMVRGGGERVSLAPESRPTASSINHLLSANRRRLWGSGLGDPVTDNWPDFGTRVTIDGTVRASCVRLTDIPEYIGASTQTEKFVWYWTVSSKRLED